MSCKPWNRPIYREAGAKEAMTLLDHRMTAANLTHPCNWPPHHDAVKQGNPRQPEIFMYARTDGRYS